MKKIVLVLFGVLTIVSSYGQDTITDSYSGYMFWPHSAPLWTAYTYPDDYEYQYLSGTFAWENINTQGALIYGVSIRGNFPLDSSISVSLAVMGEETMCIYYDTSYLDSSVIFHHLKCDALILGTETFVDIVDTCNEVYFHRPWMMPDTFFVVIRYGSNVNGQNNRHCLFQHNDSLPPQRYCILINDSITLLNPSREHMFHHTNTWGHVFPIIHPDPRLCPKPTGLHVTDRGSGWVALAWNSGAGDGYQVTVEGPDDTIVTTTTDTTILLNNLVTEGLYWVRVRSLCRYQYYGYDSTFVNPESASVGIRVSGDGVSELDADPQIGLYPNPAVASVTLNGLTVGATVTLVDLSGRTVMTFTAREKTQLIDVTPLPRGTYFVRVTDAGNAAVHKLVVQ